MSMDGMDEWDENFLDEVIRIELEALASRKPSTCPSLNPPPAPPPPPPPTYVTYPSHDPPPPLTCTYPSRDPPLRTVHNTYLARPSPTSVFGEADVAALTAGIEFSPPREMSQRSGGETRRGNIGTVPDFDMVESWGAFGKTDGGFRKNNVNNNSNNREIERLKRELTRVSKQLNNLENECTELRKDRTKKETQLKSAIGQIEIKDTEIRDLKRAKTESSSRILVPVPTFSSNVALKAGTKNFSCNVEDLKAGPTPMVQELRTGLSVSGEGSIKKTDLSEKKRKTDSKDSGVQTDLIQEANLNNNHNNEIVANQNKISKNLHWKLTLNNLRATWGRGRDIISNIIISCSEDIFSLLKSADVAETGTDEVALRIHAIIKMRDNERDQLRNFVEELLNLCRVQKVSIVGKSLRLLNRILHELVSSESTSNQRKNVVIEHGGERNNNELDLFIFKGNSKNSDFEILPLNIWVPVCETMREIVMKNQEANLISDALAVMILIVMRSDVNTDRDKFGLVPMLECIHEILKKQKDQTVREKSEIGLSVKKQAVYLLFLILNCPKILALFCTGGRENNDAVSDKSEGQTEKVLQQLISSILEDLGYCLWEENQDIKDKNKEQENDKFTSMLSLKLVRQVIILLAYIASYGESGFELLLGPLGPTRLNLLERIIKFVSNQMGLEINETDKSHPLSNKERYLVFREALILLNRLASHTIYSKTTLEVLTASQSCGSLAIEIANRMPRIGQSGPHDKNMELDIADLARGFRSRVFAFLGEK